MYSVIILNQKTMESFSQYQLLFAQVVKDNKIGVCKWIESGTTLDTALPELAALTDDKQEWHAVIVRYADDEPMSAFETDPRNPYDFLINADRSEWVGESPIPLVRLTQMLGGVPPLEVKFRTEIIREEHKAARTVYVPIEDEDREETYHKLVRKYRFDGKMPSSILIVTVRDSSYQDEARYDDTWKAHKESDSSEFWKRNHFPSVCRFMAYDFQSQGPIQREADNFKFWYAVMLLSINEWDSGTLQAYRLYSLGLKMDHTAMAEAFQTLGNRLRDTRRWIECSIRQDMEDQICEEEELPEYRMEVSVPVRRPKADEILPKGTAFKLLPEAVSADLAAWSGQCRRAERMLSDSVRSAERSLDQTADKMRDSCVFTEDQISPLNKYQEDDIRRELAEYYRTIVTIQGKLPDGDVSKNEDIQQAAASVKAYLQRRVTKKPALLAVLLSVLLMILAAVPAAADAAHGSGSYATLVAAVAGWVWIVLLTAVVMLLIQKLKLNLLVEKYDRQLKRAFHQLIERAEDYSSYMSGIGSHQRGSSYLELSSRIKRRSGREHGEKYKHIAAINVLLSRLGKWSQAFRLDVDLTSGRPDSRVDVDVQIPPAQNKLYTFDVQSPCADVAINSSGMVMGSPYPFASRIEIAREELYEDE